MWRGLRGSGFRRGGVRAIDAVVIRAWENNLELRAGEETRGIAFITVACCLCLLAGIIDPLTGVKASR